MPRRISYILWICFNISRHPLSRVFFFFRCVVRNYNFLAFQRSLRKFRDAVSRSKWQKIRVRNLSSQVVHPCPSKPSRRTSRGAHSAAKCNTFFSSLETCGIVNSRTITPSSQDQSMEAANRRGRDCYFKVIVIGGNDEQRSACQVCEVNWHVSTCWSIPDRPTGPINPRSHDSPITRSITGIIAAWSVNLSPPRSTRSTWSGQAGSGLDLGRWCTVPKNTVGETELKSVFIQRCVRTTLAPLSVVTVPMSVRDFPLGHKYQLMGKCTSACADSRSGYQHACRFMSAISQDKSWERFAPGGISLLDLTDVLDRASGKYSRLRSLMSPGF